MPDEAAGGSVTTTIRVPRDILTLLRRVAMERANRNGGRPSVSDVLRGLIERHRAELEKEIGRWGLTDADGCRYGAAPPVRTGPRDSSRSATAASTPAP